MKRTDSSPEYRQSISLLIEDIRTEREKADKKEVIRPC